MGESDPISTSFENELVPMNIYDSQGRIVMSENIQFTAGKASIKLKNIELGTYILTLIHNWEKLKYQIVKY